MDFSNMDINTIATGATSDGVRYLELFFKEYTKIFHESVNASCPKCLSNYFEKYQKKMNKSKNTSGYVLHLKYENIQLEFGSPILVNNENINEKYAKKLLERPGGERYFASMPEQSEDKKEVSIEEQHFLLIDKKTKAENHLNSLGEKVHHKTKEAATNAVNAANNALSDFRKENNLIVSDEKAKDILNANDANEDKETQLIVTLESKDFDIDPELSVKGFKVGDEVVIDAEKYNTSGEIVVLKLAEPIDNDAINKKEVSPEENL